jgi:hypothetical protein
MLALFFQLLSLIPAVVVVVRKRGDEKCFNDHVIRKGGTEKVF